MELGQLNVILNVPHPYLLLHVHGKPSKNEYTRNKKRHNIWLDESVPPVHYIMTQSKYSRALALLSSGFAHTFNALG
jgi:hypothetical protein